MIAITCTFAATMIGAPAAFAVTIFNSGPGYTSCGACYTVNDTQSLAGRFSVTQTTQITSILGWLAPGYDDNLTISLLQDNGALIQSYSLPAQVLNSASFAFGKLSSDNGFYNPRWAGVSGLNWTIGSGDYWVSFASNHIGDGSTAMPALAGTPTTIYSYYNPGNARWIQGGFATSFQVFGDQIVTATPEPSTWAMMLVGFGIVGYAARRRRQSVKTTVTYA
ncbi:MAG: PEPxxWA-CTERM sorting domain-containing protein [Novosphingobium sp.]